MGGGGGREEINDWIADLAQQHPVPLSKKKEGRE